MDSFDGWTPDAIGLVERAIAAHGGLRLWQATESIRLPFQNGSGFLLALKGYPRTFPAPREYEIFPHQRMTLFHGFPDEGHLGRFAGGNVSIESVDGGVTMESRNHRRTFAGFAKLRRWSPLDALYFFGYALWHYHVLPFTLGGARLFRVLGRSRGVDVAFSENVHTHSRRQRFYFGEDGRIVRHDYVADVIGPMARGAHFWEDYDRSGGLLIARRRRVVARLGTCPLPLEVLNVQLGQPRITQRGA
jgi:hypothetical protein